MKKRLLSVALLMGTSFVAQAQVGIGTATPNKSAELSVVANNRGLLIPNVALSDIKDAKTISNGNVESLLVFNTNGVPSRDVTSSVTPGYYYWHIDRWHRMASETDIPEIVVNQFQDILNLDGDKVKNIIQGLFNETLTVVNYDPTTGALNYIDEKGNSTVVDIAGAVKNFETVTKIEGNTQDGTLTFVDENGNTTTVNIADYVKYHETLTTLVKQKPGLYTYTNENGDTQDITVVSDLIKVIENKTDLDLYNVLKNLVKVEQSLTQLVYNASTNKLTYIDESNKENELDIDTLVKANQNNVKVVAGTNITVTQDASQKNLVTYTLDVANATKDTPGVVKPGAGLNVDADGSLNVDYTDLNSELANGTILSSSINVMMDKGSVHPTFSDVTLEIAPGKEGQVLVTGKDAAGNSYTTWEDKAAGTTNTLDLEVDPKSDNYNKVTSTVNGVESTIDLNNAVNTDMLQNNSVTAGKVDKSVAGNGLVKNETTGALDVDYPTVKGELAQGKVSSSSITVVNGKDEENTTFANVSLEITPGGEGQVLVTGKDAAGNSYTTWEDKAAGTTNTLDLEVDPTSDNYNKVTSTVNGVESTIDLNDAVNTDMLQNNSVTAGKVDKSVAGNGLVKNETTGALDVDYPTVKGELAQGKVSSSSITVVNGKDEENTTFANVSLEITPGGEGQVLVTGKDAAGNSYTTWEDKAAGTTNTLDLEVDPKSDNYNKVTSTVNGVESTIDLNDAVNTDMLQNNSITAEKVDKSVAGNGLVKNETTGALDVDYPTVKGELAQGKVSSSSITVVNGKDEENTTFANVSLEITPGDEGQVLVTGKDAAGNSYTTWEDKAAGTTNTLDLEVDPTSDNYNKVTSTVNGVESAIDLNNAVNTDMLQNNSVTAGKVDKSVAGNGLVKNETTGALDVDYPTVKGELAQGKISSKSITVVNADTDKPENTTFANVTLEITPGAAGQILTTTGTGENTVVEWKNAPSLNLDGDVVLENGKTVVEGIQNVPVSDTKPTTDGQTLVYKTDAEGKNGQWVPGMPDVNVENILNAKNLTTDGKISIGAATPAIDGDTASKKQGAVLVDTHLSIAKGSISTIEITDGTITPEDIANGGTDKVLSTDEKGNPQWMDKSDVVKANQNNVKVVAGTNITVTPDASQKNLVTYTLDVPNATKDTPGVVKPGAGLNVEDGSLNVDYPTVKTELAKGVINSNTLTISKKKEANGDETPIKSTFEDVQLEIKAGTAGQVLTTIPGENPDDLPTVSWEDVKASMPKFFYMPSVMMPTMEDQVSSQVTFENGKFVVDLYAIYEEQFGSPKLSFNAGEEKLPVLDKKELAFHITWFDSTVFTNVSFDDEGKLSYTVAPNADVTVGSFMNIVFEVK